MAHDCALETTGRRSSSSRTTSPEKSRRQHRSPCFRHRATNRWEPLLWSNSPYKRRVGNRYLHPGPKNIQLRASALPGTAAMLNWPLVRREPTFRVHARGEAAEGAGARNAPNAQAKGLTRRPSNTGVPHWRETMRSPVHAGGEIVHRRGKRGRHTGLAISQVKRTARASTRPITGGGTACPRRIQDVR
jgi:hypothetical protein